MRLEAGHISESKGTVLVVDDDQNVSQLLRVYLEREGFRVVVAGDGLEALTKFKERRPDLVILDLMLPGLEGYEVCRRIRKESSTPIIMLTARGDEVDTVVGLELGADDYVVKPFSPKELVARVKAVLRRAQAGAGQPEKPLHFPGLSIDPAGRRVLVRDQEVELTPKEFDLLYFLARNESRVFTRGQLLDKVWGYEYAGDGRTVDEHVKRIRQKVETKSKPHKYIKTVWSVGYKFEPS